MIEPFTQFGIICISGEDAANFLQGQVTCDVMQRSTKLGACCNNQGRVISNFRLYDFQACYYLLMHQSVIESTVAHLKKFAMFSKVDIGEIKNISAALQASLPKVTSDNALLLQDIAAKVVNITIDTSEKFTPHEISLEQTGAISFHKGCYQGQEIIARMHYQGKAKQHLIQAQSDIAFEPGDIIKVDDRKVGCVINCAKDASHYVLLASLRDDALDADLPFTLT
jgi:tRNA-modifying protein YgfZ